MVHAPGPGDDYQEDDAFTRTRLMNATDDRSVLTALFEGWQRHDTVLRNLLRALPEGSLDARASPASPRVAEMFTHMHHERMVSVLENAPECAGPVPAEEWHFERDANRIAAMLEESAACVRAAVAARLESGRPFDREFAHPIHLLQFLIFHEGYHHGQIKLALKLSGCSIADAQAGPITWTVWRAR